MSTGTLSTTPVKANLTSPTDLKPKSGVWDDALTFANSILPRFRQSNQELLDPQQLSAEMFTLASNQVSPVQAQTLQPLLQQPFDISLQDQLNASQADFNALQRQLGNNPEALAALAAQKRAADAQILGNQFRMNQAEKAGVYNKNRDILNQTAAQNLAIYDQQYARQEQAKSNTKAQAVVALNSISDKIAKNKLENKTLGVYENLYNYRFGPNGQAYNLNPLAQFNMAGSGKGKATMPEGMTPTWESDESGNPVLSGYKKKKEDKATARNGSIVKAIKGL
jgi:hypothetical protein